MQLLPPSHLHSLFSSSSSCRTDVFYGWKLLFHSAATQLLSVIFHSSEQLKRNTGFLGDNYCLMREPERHQDKIAWLLSFAGLCAIPGLLSIVLSSK